MERTMDKKYLLNFLGTDSNVLEAGAHIGTDTIILANLFFAGKIYCFEPVKDIFAQLKQNVAHVKNVELYELALDEVTSEKEMFISSGTSDASSSLLEPLKHMKYYPSVYFNQKETVKTMTINDWVTQNNIERIDFMWLDLQGNEYHVLTKADKILNGVKAIYSEINMDEMYKGACLYRQLKDYLAGYGFKIEIDESGYSGNVLFINKYFI
jgi:FkbM family methyltransferase